MKKIILLIIAAGLLVAATTEYRVLRIVDTEANLKTYLNPAQIAITSDSAGFGYNPLVYKDGDGNFYYLVADSQFAVLESLVMLSDINLDSNNLNNVSYLDFKNGGMANMIDTDGSLAGNSDNRIASQKAIKTYVDDSLDAENLWDKSGSLLSPHTAGDIPYIAVTTAGAENTLWLQNNSSNSAAVTQFLFASGTGGSISITTLSSYNTNHTTKPDYYEIAGPRIIYLDPDDSVKVDGALYTSGNISTAGDVYGDSLDFNSGRIDRLYTTEFNIQKINSDSINGALIQIVDLTTPPASYYGSGIYQQIDIDEVNATVLYGLRSDIDIDTITGTNAKVYGSYISMEYTHPAGVFQPSSGNNFWGSYIAVVDVNDSLKNVRGINIIVEGKDSACVGINVQDQGSGSAPFSVGYISEGFDTSFYSADAPAVLYSVQYIPQNTNPNHLPDGQTWYKNNGNDTLYIRINGKNVKIATGD